MNKVDVYSIITDKIIAQLEKGIIPWQKPWVGVDAGAPINYVTRKPYSNMNSMLLGYAGEWLTKKQVYELGGELKDNEQPSIVCFWKPNTKTQKSVDADGEECANISKVFASGTYVIPSESCFDGYRTRVTHGDIRITKNEILDAIRGIK